MRATRCPHNPPPNTRLLRCALTLSALPPPHLPPTDPTNSHLLGGCAALCTATSALPPPLLPYPPPTLPAGVRCIVRRDVCIAATTPAAPPRVLPPFARYLVHRQSEDLQASLAEKGEGWKGWAHERGGSLGQESWWSHAPSTSSHASPTWSHASSSAPYDLRPGVRRTPRRNGRRRGTWRHTGRRRTRGRLPGWPAASNRQASRRNRQGPGARARGRPE